MMVFNWIHAALTRMLALTLPAYVSFICKAHFIQSFNELLIIEVYCSDWLEKIVVGVEFSCSEILPIVDVYGFTIKYIPVKRQLQSATIREYIRFSLPVYFIHIWKDWWTYVKNIYSANWKINIYIICDVQRIFNRY